LGSAQEDKVGTIAQMSSMAVGCELDEEQKPEMADSGTSYDPPRDYDFTGGFADGGA